MNQGGMTAFFERLDALPKGDRTVLKREAGAMLGQTACSAGSPAYGRASSGGGAAGGK